MENGLLNRAKDFFICDTSYDNMLFLTSPIAFTGVRTHDIVFTKPTLPTYFYSLSLQSEKNVEYPRVVCPSHVEKITPNKGYKYSLNTSDVYEWLSRMCIICWQVLTVSTCAWRTARGWIHWIWSFSHGMLAQTAVCIPLDLF